MSELQELLVDELKDLLSAEGQLVKDAKLKAAFLKHAEETQGHIERLKQIFEAFGEPAKAKTCKAMQGLVEEGLEILEEGKGKDESISDLGLVAAAQKVEHYEMASYGTARTIAEQLGHKMAVKLLQQTLKEEEKTDLLLTKLSTPMLAHAVHAGVSQEEAD